MPWHKVHGHAGCPASRSWAVVKDDDGDVEGCHPTEASADRQLAVLYASEEDASTESESRMPIRVAGIAVVEGEPSGDGRMFEHGALSWEGMLPIPIVWDRVDGDHTAMTVGFVDTMERRDGGVIWVEGSMSETGDEITQAAIDRATELLGEGAVGVSLRWDDVQGEMRVKRAIVEGQMAEMESMMNGEAPVFEESADGQRFVVAKFAADDVLEVTTFGRPRHLAIVDTAAWAQAKISVVTTGAIAASALAGDWSGFEHLFDDPKFGDYSTDARLRYDPDRGVWSCPPTVTDDGRYFGHITPMGICLRGRTDRCVNPPDGDLEGFMRGRAPAAGGRRTGVICLGGGSSHCDVGIGAAMATQHYDSVGHAIADVRVGNDRYGIWFSGMIRPGTPKENIYAAEASDVSGHWEFTKTGRMTLVGLPAVSVGGFPKGYLTYDEFRGGLAAAGGITVEEGCGTLYGELADGPDIDGRLARIEMALGEMYAAHLRSQDLDV